MSHWALLLLATYVVLGLSSLPAAKATRLAVGITVAVISYTMLKLGATG